MSSGYVAENNGLGLTRTFGIASAFIVCGVLSGWVYLKQEGANTTIALPVLDQNTVMEVAQASTSEQDWVETAESAFAAGRIVEPVNDNALYYFQRALEATPGDARAHDGVQRVLTYLMNAAESAVFRNEWARARELTKQIAQIEPAHTGLASLRTRLDRLERLDVLNQLAVSQLAAGKLTAPAEDSALATYRRILEMDPAHEGAKQGIHSIAQRLLATAQAAALADDQKTAVRLLKQAKAISPDAPGLKETERLTLQWTRMVKDQSEQEKLIAASQALQEGRLIDPPGDNALDLYEQLLKRNPGLEAAQRGKELVAKALLDRAWSLASADELAAAGETLESAVDAGADELAVAALEEELAARTKRQRAREGKFDRTYAIGELTAKRQVTPDMPRGAENGYVEIAFTVSEEGEVVDPKVEASTDARLEEAAMKAIVRWRFEPVVEAGRVMPVRSAVRFSFQR